MNASRYPRRGERGQTVPLIALVLLVAGGLAWAVAVLGGRAAAQGHVRSAADAAALAGAVAGEPAAAEVAAANHAALESFRQQGDVVEVRVQAGGFRAVAWAERVVEVVDE
jgi:hypothetical protein